MNSAHAMTPDEQRLTAEEEAVVDEMSAGRRLPLPSWRALILMLFASALIAGGLVLVNSPLMEIRDIEVRGTQELSAEAVAQITGLVGKNILIADLGAARTKILDQPLVQDVSISRRWPNSVRVEIVERTPWAQWEVEGEVWTIDAKGVVLEKASAIPAPEESTVVRQVSSLPAIHAGAHVDLGTIVLIRTLSELGPPRGGPDILGYEWSLKQGLTVVTKHGRLRFGDGDGFEFKYAVWEEIEAEALNRGEPLLFADLRFGTRPVVEMGLGLGRATRIVDPFEQSS